MRRMLVLLIVVFVASGCFVGSDISAYAEPNVSDSGEKTYDSEYTEKREIDIVPTVSLFDPGSIQVRISWVTPSLVFTKKMRKNNTEPYYALKNDVDVLFTVENLSTPSLGAGYTFDGSVIVTPTCDWAWEYDIGNLSVRMVTNGSIGSGNIELTQNESNNTSIHLEYLNISSQEEIDKLSPESILSVTKSSDDIKSIMTVKVNFEIVPKKLIP